MAERGAALWPMIEADIRLMTGELMHATIELYEGNGAAAYRLLDQDWRRRMAFPLARLRYIRAVMLVVHGVAALAAYRSASPPTGWSAPRYATRAVCARAHAVDLCAGAGPSTPASRSRPAIARGAASSSRAPTPSSWPPAWASTRCWRGAASASSTAAPRAPAPSPKRTTGWRPGRPRARAAGPRLHARSGVSPSLLFAPRPEAASLSEAALTREAPKKWPAPRDAEPAAMG